MLGNVTRRRCGGTPWLAAALAALFLLAAPYVQHDSLHEAGATPFHCAICALKQVGTILDTRPPLDSWRLGDAGSVVVLDDTRRSAAFTVRRSGRSPPLPFLL